MKAQRPQSELKPDAPALLKQLRWLQLHGLKHWKLLLVATVFVISAPTYKVVSNYIGKPKSLGAFELIFKNQLTETLEVGQVAELYLTAPEAPGVNRKVSSGLIKLNLPPKQYTLNIPPGKSISATATMVNEDRLLPYLGAGEYFGLIIFSASPKPIRVEILFTRDTFKNGVRLEN